MEYVRADQKRHFGLVQAKWNGEDEKVV